MKRLFTLLAGVLLVMGTFSYAFAYSYYDIIPNQPDPYPVNSGDPFSVSIYMKGDGNDTWNNYTFDIGWDDSELALKSTDPLSAEEFWPPGFFDGFGGPISYNAAEGTIEISTATALTLMTGYILMRLAFFWEPLTLLY